MFSGYSKLLTAIPIKNQHGKNFGKMYFLELLTAIPIKNQRGKNFAQY